MSNDPSQTIRPVFLISVFLFSFFIAGSQTTQQGPPIVPREVHHDTSPPLASIPPVPVKAAFEDHDIGRIPRPYHEKLDDPVLQNTLSPLVIPTPILNFDGLGNGFTGFSVQSAPPDTQGDVGPNHYVQIVNSSFVIFNKSGTAIFGPAANNTLWSGFGGGCQTNNDGDGVVLYDPIANRWIISQFSVSTTPYLQCVAVSTTADPTGSYNRYSFSYGTTDFPDYPKMGVWPDAYYESFNIFANGSSFAGALVCAYDRARMLSGQAATQQCFTTTNSWGALLPSDLDGSRLPPTGAPNTVVGLGTNDLGIWKFHVDWTTPANSSLTGPAVLAVAAFSDACGTGTCIPQGGTTRMLDSLGDRLMFRLPYRNLGDHESLVASHSVTAGSSVGVRWYELRLDAVTRNASLFQQGTYAPAGAFRWMGSIAMDQSGNIGLGFSTSNSTLHPEVRYTGRLAADPLGTMGQGEGTIIAGAGSQTGSSGLTRWGDDSMVAVDPTDDCTFWYTTEYIPANGEFNWATRIGSFKFPSCVTAPASISGTVIYGNAIGAPTPRYVSNVLITGAGSPAVSTTTGAPGATAGQYMLTGFGSGMYTVTPTKTTGQNGINSFDAAKVASYVAGVSTLTASQLVAADVSGNGNVNSFDAAEIASYVVSGSNPGMAGTWKFTPSNRSYATVASSLTSQDFTAYLMGDVSGNWTNSGARPDAAGPQKPIAIDASQLVIPADGEIVIPVTVQGAANKGVVAYEFDLRYDPAVIEPQASPVDLAGTLSREIDRRSEEHTSELQSRFGI